MDTTHMEYTAEDLIAHKLQRAGILVSKPKFDREGTDLIGLMEVKDGARFCRIQCKGRSLIKSKTANISISQKYVTDCFIVFLFIEDGNERNTPLYSFFKEDIQQWKLTDDDKFVLNFTLSNFKDILQNNIFSQSTIVKIKEIISKADVKAELKIFMPCLQVEGHSFDSKVIFEDDTKVVRIERTPLGTYRKIVTNKATGAETIDFPTLENLENCKYNPSTDTFTNDFSDIEDIGK